MKTTLFLLTLVLAQTVPTQQSTPSGVIEGTVVRAGTSTPVGKVRITLSPVQGGTAAQGATTDSDGHFSFRSLAPGQYRLSATRDGYVSSEYGQRGPNGSGTPVSVMAQQTVKDLRIGMTMTGTIAGRITNRDGEPVGNANVQAMRYTYQDGRRTLTTIQSIRTNDLGEYRLFWMNPGQYVVSAQPTEPLSLGTTDTFFIQGARAGGPALAAAAGAQLGVNGVTRITITGGGVGPGGGPGGGAIGGAVPPPPPPPPPPNVVDSDQTYLPVYYPGTTDVAAASAIDLRAGGTVDSINMVVADVRPVHIRGLVTTGGRGAAGTQVSMYPRNNTTGNLTVRSTTATDTGAFDFRNVAPGAYELVATVNGAGLGAMILGTPLAASAGFTVLNVGGRGGAGGPGSPNSTMMAARVPVDVSSSDVDGVSLALEPGFNLSGQVSIDGRSPSNNDSNLPAIRIQLQSEPPIPPLAVVPSNPDSNGAFSLSGIAIGTYRLAVAGMPRNTYLKSANLGGTDVLTNGLRLDSQPAGPLDIVLGTTPGSLDAVVLDEKQMPEASVAVVLVPNAPLQKRFDIYRNGTTDSMGRIHWDGLVPGDYKVYAWEDVENYAWTDPNFMANSDGRGTAVRITDGSRDTVNVKVIPYKTN